MRKMRSRSARIAVLLAAVAALSACGGKPVVGILLPTSGFAATYGESMKNGIELALDEARETKTMPSGLQLVWGDSGSDTERAVAEYRRLVGEGGANGVIVGTTSDEAKAILPLLEKTHTGHPTPPPAAPGLTKAVQTPLGVVTS